MGLSSLKKEYYSTSNSYYYLISISTPPYKRNIIPPPIPTITSSPYPLLPTKGILFHLQFLLLPHLHILSSLQKEYYSTSNSYYYLISISSPPYKRNIIPPPIPTITSSPYPLLPTKGILFHLQFLLLPHLHIISSLPKEYYPTTISYHYPI